MRAGARLAFDVGKARVGVARCDEEAILALPVVTLERDRYGADLDEAADLVEEHRAIEAIVGLPLHMGGGQSSSTQDATAWARQLAARIVPIPVRLVDERLSTVSAQRSLHESGQQARNFRAVVDQAAAVVILDQALQTERLTGEPAGRQVFPKRKGHR